MDELRELVAAMESAAISVGHDLSGGIERRALRDAKAELLAAIEQLCAKEVTP